MSSFLDPILQRRRRLVARLLSVATGFLLPSAIGFSQPITEFPLPVASPVYKTGSAQAITAGPDGALWFLEIYLTGGGFDGEETSIRVGRVTTSGSFTEYPVATGPRGRGEDITTGPDGALWFTMPPDNKIGRITTSGVVTQFPVPTPAGWPTGITAGPDGNLWFTEQGASKIGRLTPAGVFTEFPLPSNSSYPTRIVAGPDGNLWFTEWGSSVNNIGRISTAGAITEYPSGLSYGPYAITVGPDGNIWFTGGCCGFGFITTAGDVTTFIYPSTSNLSDIATGPDGGLWVTLVGDSAIGRIPLSGIGPTSIPTSRASGSLVVGPDNAIWFAEGDKIGRLQVTAVVSVSPATGPAAGGTGLTLHGVNFQPGASVTIGGESAVDVLVIDGATITASTPQLPPGSLNDIVVTNPDTTSATLTKGWFTDFADVSGSYLYAAAIEKLVRAGITTGCGGGKYCADAPVNRAAMAVFILRGKHGAGFQPPDATGAVFGDVQQNTFLAKWIETFAAEGFTTGCGNGGYCPALDVNRSAMSVFLLRAKNGSGFQPPPASGTVFGDVHVETFLAKWIEALQAAGITQGCGSGNFCPDNTVSRGEMAAFIRKTFGL